jgi:hypothetical protein
VSPSSLEVHWIQSIFLFGGKQMTEKLPFSGKIVRLERDGFGVIEFDQAIGATSNTHGIFSTDISEPGVPFRHLRQGMQVKGLAEVDDRDLAAVKTIELEHAE